MRKTHCARRSACTFPQKESVAVYEELFRLYRRLYFALGVKKSEPVTIGDVLPQLRRIAEKARKLNEVK